MSFFEKSVGELLDVTHEGWVYLGEKRMSLRSGTKLIVLNDLGHVKLHLESGHDYYRRLEVLTPHGPGIVYLDSSGNFVK